MAHKSSTAALPIEVPAPNDDTRTRILRPANPRRKGRLEVLESQVGRLLDRMNIAVVYGGDSKEPQAVINRTMSTRSWKSYKAVAEDIAASLSRLGARNVQLLADDMTLGENMRRAGIHMAWLNTGGVQGFSPMSHAAAMLEMFGIPYVGHDPLTSGMLDNKLAFKRELKALGVPTAPFLAWHPSRGPLKPEASREFAAVFGGFDGPFVVKPVCGRASLHVHVVDDRARLPEVAAEVHEASGNQVLIETYLPGREYCMAIAGTIVSQGRRLRNVGGPFAFSAAERRLDQGERIFTSMDMRAISTDRVHLLDIAAEPEVDAQLREIAKTVFVQLGLETLIRLDLRAGPDDQICVLEANPKPDLKQPDGVKTSIVCVGLESEGMDYDDLILSLLADRIDLLFSQRRGAVGHLAALLDEK
ncbi:MAG: D-alanyl-alanine synthetase [Alphaproteobacteria bacterium]|nr:D-alanyl-alanine synthetase [Alphaproteobacteria bacterium]